MLLRFTSQVRVRCLAGVCVHACVWPPACLPVVQGGRGVLQSACLVCRAAGCCSLRALAALQVACACTSESR